MSWRDRISKTERLDAACELLMLAARELGADWIEVDVHRGARVEIRARKGPFTKHIARADLAPDDGLSMPSCELCDMLDGERMTGEVYRE